MTIASLFNRSYRSYLHLLAVSAVGFVFAPAILAQTPPQTDRVIPQSRQPASRSANFKNAVITEKPRAVYTEEAKYNGVEGSVRLRVQLLASGQIGEVVPLSYLPWGLTEQAVRAARQIRFRPQTHEGRPMDAEIEVEYTFSLFYEDDDAEIVSKVEIQRMPKPEIAPTELPPAANGRIQLKVYFSPGGRASIVNTLSPVPIDLQPKLREAVERIRFRPAVHRSGKRAGVTRTIVYEF